MTALQHKHPTQPHAAIDVVVDSGSMVATCVARCECGWNAVECGSDLAAVHDRLTALVREHHATCDRATRQFDS